MFLCFLLGGMGMSLTIGLLDVFVRHPLRVTAAPGPAHPEGTMRRWTLPAMVSL